MDYSILLDHVLKSKTLVKWIEQVAYDDSDVLNLVRPDWEQVLQNNLDVQRFKTNPNGCYRKLVGPGDIKFQNFTGNSLYVMFVSYCTLSTPKYEGKDQKLAVITQDGNPIVMMLGDILSNDRNVLKTFVSESVKLPCSPCGMACLPCREAANEMKSNGIALTGSAGLDPCIANTMVFDGVKVMNRFGCQMRASFHGQFVAIVVAEFNKRYFYTQTDGGREHVKIGGKICKLLAFPDSNLRQRSNVFLGDLTQLSKEMNIVQADDGDATPELEMMCEQPLVRDSDEDVVIDIHPAAKKMKKDDDVYQCVREEVDY